MVTSVEKDDNNGSDNSEQQKAKEYEQNIMSRVPFGDLGVATESHDQPFGNPFKSKND